MSLFLGGLDRSTLGPYLESIIKGGKTVEMVFDELCFRDVQVCNLSIDELTMFYDMVKAVKEAGIVRVKIKEQEDRELFLLSYNDLLMYLFNHCRTIVSELSANGILFTGNCSVFRDGMEIKRKLEDILVFWDSSEDIAACLTSLLNNGKTYKLVGSFSDNYVGDENVFYSLRRFRVRSVLDRDYLYKVIFPEIRKSSPDRFYAFLNSSYMYYSRDHYLRDQFMHLISHIPVEKRKDVVIFGPMFQDEEYYGEMGFKVYVHDLSVDHMKREGVSYVTDLTGYYVLFDPSFFFDKLRDGDDSLVGQRYGHVSEVAKGIGFLKFYNFNTESKDIPFIKGYDAYMYTPHKPCFYMVPQGLIALHGHQVFFRQKKGLYNAFLLIINMLRTCAYAYDYAKLPNDLISFLREDLFNAGVLTKDDYEFSGKVLGFFKSYFDFPLLSYISAGREFGYYDDRRYLSKTDVQTLLPRESSVHTLMNVGYKNVVHKRGYYLVSNRSNVNVESLQRYSDFKKNSGGSKYNRTGYRDKYSMSGPFLNQDQKQFLNRSSESSLQKPWNNKKEMVYSV